MSADFHDSFWFLARFVLLSPAANADLDQKEARLPTKKQDAPLFYSTFVLNGRWSAGVF
jgi:hypothetical protein